MKLHKILFLLAIVAMAATSSCNKYEDGPSISLRSKARRIANTWKYEKYIVNGVELAGTPSKQTLKQFWSANGEMNTTYINQVTGVAETVNGNWELIDNDSKIRVTQNNVIQGIPETTIIYTVLKLSNKEMWLRSADLTTDIQYVPSN
jgi:predicted NAD/FAD-dependent oxidoreductase